MQVAPLGGRSTKSGIACRAAQLVPEKPRSLQVGTLSLLTQKCISVSHMAAASADSSSTFAAGSIFGLGNPLLDISAETDLDIVEK